MKKPIIAILLAALILFGLSFGLRGIAAEKINSGINKKVIPEFFCLEYRKFSLEESIRATEEA